MIHIPYVDCADKGRRLHEEPSDDVVGWKIRDQVALNVTPRLCGTAWLYPPIPRRKHPIVYPQRNLIFKKRLWGL
jgi:hypothetical protein